MVLGWFDSTLCTNLKLGIMYIVIKEFAGIKVGTKRNFSNPKMLIEKGLIEAVKEKPQKAPENKAVAPKENKRKPRAKK